MSSTFPLVTLQPVADASNAWVALMLAAEPADSASLSRIFGEFGLAAALGPLPCVLTLPDLAAAGDALPAAQIVLCLPVALCCDAAHAASLQGLRQKGFRLMASGLPLPGQTLGDGVDAFALACPGTSAPVGMGAWLGKLPGPHLALGVAALGCPGRCHFQWLAGHAADPARQSVLGKSVDAPNRVLLLELLSQVTNDADSHAIEATIKRDPQLSYHLLKLVNSVVFALTTKIASFNQAITLLGRRQLQRWLQLLLYARSRDGDKANTLLPRAALRAGLTEALCKATGGSRDAQDRAFMAGMFSLLDVLFGMPIAAIVQPLNLADDVLAALTQRSGPLGPLLRAAEASENATAAELEAILAAAGVSHEDWARSLVSACRWAIQISREA
ncbi:MAG: HDOD domain-containing protein [Rhodocyclaceae bacterium]|nr:HDOD domain-containing protein [Rhodocyclaceae bacterium]